MSALVTALFSEIVRLAYAHRTRRRRRFDMGELFQPPGEQIRLEQLRRLPAYQTFVADRNYLPQRRQGRQDTLVFLCDLRVFAVKFQRGLVATADLTNALIQLNFLRAPHG